MSEHRNGEFNPNLSVEQTLGKEGSNSYQSSGSARFNRVKAKSHKQDQRIAQLEKKLEKAQSQEMRISDGDLTVQRSIRRDGQTWYNEPASVSIFGELSIPQVAKALGTLLYVGNQAARGLDVINRKPQKERDKDGNFVQSRDADGKELYHPNPLDRTVAIARLLASNPTTCEALQTIEDFLSKPEVEEELHGLLIQGVPDRQATNVLNMEQVLANLSISYPKEANER
jgi:hypothetical protein